MRKLAPSPAAAAVLLAAACSCAAPPAPATSPPPPPPAEWNRELDPSLQLHDVVDADDVTTVIPVRVLDDASGTPIPGARIDNWTEAEMPHAEPWEDMHCGSWTTDGDGFALVPTQDRAAWWFVEAPGYGPRAEMGFEDERRLMRGADVPIVVRDWRDRTVPGAVVEALLGCGHTPTVRVATAGPDGRLVLPCIDPSHATDLWIRTPGLAGRNAAYWGDGPEELPVEGTSYLLRGDPSAVIEGRVLRADGTPAGGAIVGTREAHRGPWTVADGDGRFRLIGAPNYDTLTARAPLADAVPEGFDAPQREFQSVPGVFATVTLPASGQRTPTREEREAERKRYRAEREAREAREAAGIEEPDPPVPPEGPGIRVRVTSADASAAHGRVRIVLVRDGDGAAAEEYPKFRGGVAARAIVVGPGAWTVTAGSPAGGLRPESRRIEVASGWSEVEFVLAPNPVWTPRWAVRTADGSVRELDAPPPGRLRIVTDDGEVEATPATPPAADEEESDTPPASIRVPAQGTFAVRLRNYGRDTVRVLEGPPRDGEALLVVPPEEPDEEPDPDAEPPRDFPPARVTVIRPDGRPHDGQLEVRTPPRIVGRPPRLERGDERYLDLDDAGSVVTGLDRGEILGAEIETDEPGLLLFPAFARVEGPGPWNLRWPATEVVVRATDEQGVPFHDFAVSLGGWNATDAHDGAVRIVGAPAGPLRLWVAAPGQVVRDLRIVVTEGGRREVVVRLRARGRGRG